MAVELMWDSCEIPVGLLCYCYRITDYCGVNAVVGIAVGLLWECSGVAVRLL